MKNPFLWLAVFLGCAGWMRFDFEAGAYIGAGIYLLRFAVESVLTKAINQYNSTAHQMFARRQDAVDLGLPDSEEV